MNLQDILFWLFSIAMLVSGALVITRHNPVNSAMFLIQVFLCMAGLFLLLEAFFLAIIQVLVYAGAVMVLGLFVIMLLNLEPVKGKAFPRAAAAGAMVLLAALGAGFFMVLNRPIVLPVADPTATITGGLRDVLKPLFSDYLLPFELTALIVLVAMIGVVILSKQEANRETRP
jgi:NADH-quinone oxidoreductase subunit J